MASKNKIAVDIKSSFDKKGVTAAKNGVDDFSKSTKSATSKMLEFGKAAIGFASVAVAIKAVAAEISKMDQAWQVQETAEIKLQAVLQATENQLGTNLIELKNYATELANLTGIADENILAAQGVMATFTKIGKDVFPVAIERAADMSAMFSQDLQQSVVQLGTAINDPIAGVGRLKRIGISFTEEQKNTIKSFMDLNDLAGAQAVILDELEAEFGGVAAAMGDSAAGASKKLSNAWVDLYEQGGRVLNEFLKPLREELTNAINQLTEYIKKSLDMKEIAEKMELGIATDDEQMWLLEQKIKDYEKLKPEIDAMTEKLKSAEAKLLPQLQQSLNYNIAKNKKLLEEGGDEYIQNLILLNELRKEQEAQNNELEERNRILQYENDSWAMITGQIESLSDPLQFQLENLKEQIETAKEFLQYGKENNFSAEETAEIQEAINLMKQKTLELQEQINEKNKQGNEDLTLFAKMQNDAIAEIQKTSDLKEVQAELEEKIVNATEEELEIYKLMKAEVDKLLDVEEERTAEIEQHLVYAKMVAEWEDEQNQKREEGIALIQAQLALYDAIMRNDLSGIEMNMDILAKLGGGPKNEPDEEDPREMIESTETSEFFGKMSSVSEVFQLFAEGANAEEIFINALINAALEVEGMTEVLNAISTVFDILFQMIGPYATAILNPFLDILKTIALEIANNLVPVLVPLIPLMEIIAEIVSTAIIPSLAIFSIQMDLLSIIFTLLLPVLKGLAIAFEIIMSPVRFLADLFTWAGDVIKTFIWNITHPFSQKGYTAFSSDAFSGLEDRIKRILEIGENDPGITGLETGSGTSVYGGNTTVNKPPDLKVYINFHGPVVAEGGMAKVGEFVAASIQEYIGIGGKVEFLEEKT